MIFLYRKWFRDFLHSERFRDFYIVIGFGIL